MRCICWAVQRFERSPEITEVTEAQAAQLFQQLAQLTFWTNVDTQAPVPFHYRRNFVVGRALSIGRSASMKNGVP